ncbi:hypothetical protein [Streptomyces poonensis]|uniref:Uncharacterized protein n=1 Tax=Streptomyces poonensis TaxID=68255 RepID=A0A918UDC0_9ACTN|nr:hypothetical protein [Streptomyces poonensis]GGY95811.1 hypothetical protein GCM10010365_13390 [Streptomyces poonensis]GLJ88870.1 hypothetical protein GCM10017589_14700 [Streptomyces poonensis]
MTLALATGALGLAATGIASADTNKSQQASNVSGPTAPVLSPAAARPDDGQGSRQTMDKAHSTNWAVLDYLGDKPFDDDNERHGILSGNNILSDN